MPDKKYLIDFPDAPDSSAVWEADKWERNKDAFMSENKDSGVNVFELEDYNPEDVNEHDQIIISFDDNPEGSAVWDSAKWERNKEAFMAENPTAKVQRVRYNDYWGEQATANREQRALLAQPDQERNAKLADLGYYDDITGEAFSYTQSEEGIPQWGPSLGLQPLSSIVGENEDGTTSYADPKVAEFFAKDTSYTDRMAEIARLDAEYESNPAVIAQREWEAEWRAEQAKYAENLENQIRKDAKDAGHGNLERMQMRKAAPMLGMGHPLAVAQYNAMYADADLPDSEANNFAAALNMLELAKEARTVKDKKAWQALTDEAQRKFMAEILQPAGANYVKIGNILTRIEKEYGAVDEESLTPEKLDELLTKDEQALILSFMEYNAALADAQVDASTAYKGAQQFAKSVPFMLEMMVTGGLYNAAGKAATSKMTRSLMEWAAKKGAGKALRKFAAKSAIRLTYGAAGTLARTVVAPSTYKAMAEGAASSMDDEGHMHKFKGAVVKGLDKYIENFSEITGDAFGLVGKGLAKSLGKIDFGKFGKFLADSNFMQKAGHFLANTNDLLKQFGFHGFVGEIGEELIGSAIREVTLVQPGAMKEMFEGDNFGAMLIGFAPMSLFGAGMSAVSMGAMSIEAANLGKKLRETLGYHYSEEQIDHMMNLVEKAENGDQVAQAINTLEGLNQEEAQQLWQYGAFMAQNKAMIFARKAQEDNLAQAKRAEFQQQYGNFWQTSEEGAESVQIAEIKDSSDPSGKRTVFVTSAPNENGTVAIIDAKTGKLGFSNVSEYVEQKDKDGNTSPMTRTWSMDAFLESRIASERLTAQEARMSREYNEQVQNLQSQITSGTKINLGTTGNPIWMVATGQTSKDGVFAVDSTGATHTIGWMQVADAMNQPIRVKTDQEIIDEEVAAVVARNAERRKKMRNATPAMTDAVNESAVQSAEVVAQENKHIPMNEDGTVNEIAFWEQDPEGYAAWNDEQNQDGGADTREQIANSKAILAQMLTEAVAQQQTSNPVVRKQAKKNAEEIQAQIDKLSALEAKYEEQRIAPFRERAMKWKGLTNAPVHIIETEEELAKISAEAAEAPGKKSRVRGMAKDGKAYIYLPGITEASEIDAVFMHEAVAHTGLKGMLGQQAFDELCDQVWEMMSPEARQVFIGYPGVNGNKRAAADEYIAHIAERMGAGVATAEEKTIWQKIVDFVRNVLRAMGVDINVSESELADLLQLAYKDLAKNMAEAEKIAKQNAAATQARRDAPTAAKEKYDEYLTKGLTAEEIKALAQNEFDNALKEYNDLQAQAPKVEMGESVEDFIARKKAYNDKLAKAKALLDEKQTMMDEIARREKPADDSQAPEVVEDLEQTQQPDGSIRLSMVTYNDWTDNLGNTHKGTRTQVIERMIAMNFSDAERNEMLAKMDTAYEYMEKLRSLTNEDGSVRFDEFNAWAEKTPLYKQVGRDYVKAITSLVSNGDYPINMELTTDCIKREAFTMLLNTLVKRGADLSKMGPGEIVTIQKMMNQYGIEVACKLCFVEGKRLQIVNWASQIVEDWNNALVEAGVTTDEYFEFGKDGDAFIPAEEWRTHENKAEVAKMWRQLDEIGLLFQGIDPKQFKRQQAKNKKAVEKYKKEKAEAWAKKTKKPISQWKPTDKQAAEIKKMSQEGLAPKYVNENMEEYRNAFNAMRNEWLEKHPGKDPLSFTPTKKQWEALGKIRNRQIDTVRAKMVRLIMEYPEMRKKMTLNDLLGSKGLMEIRQQHGQAYADLYSIILQRFGTGTPKPVQDAVPYDGELMTLSESAFKKANEIGGARLFSFSDFDITKVFDYMQMFFDLEANRQMLQSYTKEVAAVIIFGRSNAKFNISTLANAYVPQEVLDEYAKASEGKQKEMRHKWAENAGLLVDEAGNITGINFSEEHSVSPAFAQQIFHDEARNKDCGAIMVGASVNHAIYSAAQTWIRMVIPFHLSGMPKAAQDKTDVKWYFDNTAFQSTRKKTKDGWSKIESSEDTFKFYDDMNAPGWNMRDKTKQYLAWCKEKGFRPKFDWGINSDYYRAYCEEQGYEPNQQIIDIMDADTTDGVWNQYYKFLTDFTAYKPVFNEQGEMIDEIPSPQLPVQSNFDFSEMERDVLFEGEKSMLGHREENIKKAERHMDALAAQVVPYLNGEITEDEMGLRDDVFYKSSTDAENYLEALAEQQGTRLSAVSESAAEGEDVRFSLSMESLDKAAKTIRNWTDNGLRGRSFELTLPQDTLAKVRAVMGRDFDSHNITANGVAHALNSHGVGGYNLQENSIPITADYVELIPYIMVAPDYVTKGSTDATGRESVRFYKNLSNGYVVVIEKEYKNSPDDMETINMWAEMSSKATNAQHNAAPGINVQNAILSTDIAKIHKDAESAIERDANTRLSVITPQMDADYLAAVERGDMETAQRMVDEAATAAGYTIRGDHGRVSKFTVFDRNKANPEGNWGQGFYFSNNEEDVENNYATVDGPDLEAKIEREVERRVNLAEMNEDFNEDGEVDEFAIRDAVEKEFITSEPNVVHAAIKMDNPFVVGHGMVEIGEDGLGHYDMEETYLTVEYETDEDGEIDYDVEPTGTLVDLAEALNDELSEYEGVNINAYEILSNNIDGMTASQFEKEARELLENSVDYLQNDDLATMTSEIIRAAIERAGFDGIVDNTVNQKFGDARRFGQSMAGVNADTRHYVVFDSSQIKVTDPATYDDDGNVIPLSERFNPENEDIRFSAVFNSANEELNNTGLSMDNPALMQEYGLSAIELSKKGDYVTLSKIVTEEKGQGNGTRFMEDLTKNADANGWTLALTPDTTYGGSSVARLKKFYKRFGFKENKGRYADFNTKESMVRQSDVRFSVIGEVGALRDKTPEGIARLENLDVARQMESQLNPDWSAKENEAALKIKIATGWERGADGLWRYEVEDVMIEPINQWIDSKKKLRLGDIVKDGEVMRLYPDLADITIVKKKSKTDLGAAYNPKSNTIKLPFAAVRDARDAYRALPLNEELQDYQAAVAQMYLDVLHEVQHAIQHREGFAKGGNSKTMTDPQKMTEYRSLHKQHNDLVDQYNDLYNQYYAIPAADRNGANPDAARLLDKMKTLDAEIDRIAAEMDRMVDLYSVGKSGYKKLAGEVESRNVEARIMKSADERRTSLLSSTEDVARKDQIFIMNAMEQAESPLRFSAVQIDPAVRQEMDTIKAKAMWDGTFMKAPNGAETKLTEDQWLLVRTNNFKNWFGDWENDPENASKIVDENGEPMVMYHGSAWEPLMEPKGKAVFRMNDGLLGRGAYFSNELAEATLYAEIATDLDTTEEGNYELLQDKYVTDYFLNVRNEEDIFREGNDMVAVAKSPSQIKSATETTGEFSENEDIRFSVGDFGEIYEQFRGKPKEAIAFLMEKQSGEAVGALYHPEIGEIDLVWGEAGTGKSDGYGLAKLVKFHPEVIDNLQEILSEMQIVKQSANRINLESDKYQAAVRLTWNNKAKKWLLTAFEKKNSVLDNTTDTGETSKGSKQNDTATLQDTVSDSKDSDNIENSNIEENISFSVRTKPAPQNTGIGYKVFYLKDGKLYPPMVANIGGVDTPVMVWLDADAAPIAGQSKTGRTQVKAGGKGTQGGSGTLAYRPGWHLGEIPYALQFNRKDEKGEKTLFPANFVWAEVEYADDVNYQEEAMSYGINANGKFQHSLAGLPKVPTDGSYRYRTNPNPETDPWIITGAMKVNRLLTPSEVDQMVIAAGREPQKRQEGAVTDEQINALNESLGLSVPADDTRFSAISTPTDNVVAEGMKFSIQDFARLAGNIFQDMPESFRKEAIEETFKRGWDMQSAIFQIPARLAEKENWDETDKDLAKVIREKVQDAMDESGVVMSRPLTTKEALWMLYRSTGANTDSMLDAAKRSIVAHNLGFDSRSMALKKAADDYIRYSVVRNRQIDAATDMYNYEANLWTSRLAESWLDMNQSVIALQNALAEASGKPIASWENVVLALNQLSSKSYTEKKKYLRDFLMPLWDQIIEMTKVSGLSIEQIERYMMLKHGIERNKKFAMRDAKQFYREMYDKVADRMKNTSHAEQVVALSEAKKRIADIDAQIATASGKKLKDLQEARERAVVEKEIAELVLRNDEQQNEADLQMYFNAIEAENNPKYVEFREKDYGGLTSMFMDQIADVKRSDYKTDEAYQAALLASVKPRFDKVADMEAEAQKEVDDYESKAYMPALWKLVNAATKETLRHQHATGVITTEQYDVVRNMFDYYVPLRGFADNTAEDMYSYYMNNSAGGFAKPIIAAKGRKTRAESPLGWIGTMAESAIQQDNKNEVKMKLYYALMNRPDTGVLSLSEMWYVYDHTDPSTGRKVFVPAYPPATGGVLTADQMRQHMDAWEQSMKAKQAVGEAYKREQGVNLGGSVIFQDKAQDAEHIIRVKVAGKDYAILVNGNPRAAQAINGLLNPDANVGPVRQWYGALRRGLSALMTSFSPLFWVANYQRDLLSSFMRTSLNEGWEQAFKYLGNRFHGWKAAKYIYRYDNGTMGDSYYENLYKEFAENGGITGYTSLTTNKEYEKLLADYAENVDKETLNWIKGVWDKFMGFGEAIEQVSRFAAYITARESGKSIEEAVAAAKEVSVNFNRKGSTSPISLDELEKLRDKNGKPLSMPKKAMAIVFSAMPSALKELYFFFNASIQALSSSAKLARKSPGKAMAWAGMYMGLSVGLAFLNYLLAGDDDDNDYLDLPDYLRHSTALFKMGDNYYFKWSLPQEMRPFYATADILVSKIMGKTPHKTAWNTVGDIALAAAEWLPVNPFGTEDPILALVPDVAAPLAEIKANQNSFGGRIYNDMPFMSEDVAKQIPAYRKGTSKTGERYVDMAEFLNDITGGNEVEKGIINLNPAIVEHLVGGYGGGIYDFGKLIVGIPELIYDAVWGEGVEVRDIPFVNKVLLSTDETNMNSHVNEAFYHYQGIADNAKRVENEYRKSDDPSRADDYMAEDDWRIYMLFRQYEEDLKMADEKVLDAVDDTEKELAFQEQNVIREMLLNDIARGVRPSTETVIKVAVESIRKEANDLLKPSREAERKLDEAKRRRNKQAADAAKREFDSLRDLPEYKKGMSLKKDLDKIKRNLDKLQYMSPGTQRDSVLDKVQRDYDALLKKAREE